MQTLVASKDPDNVEPYFVIWCDKETGLNDGSKNDHGELQGATISTVLWIMPSDDPPELTKKSSNQNALTIAAIDYDINTVCTIWLEGGVANKDYSVTCRITTDDGRMLDKTIIIPVREN
jgi:hypothetical protein